MNYLHPPDTSNGLARIQGVGPQRRGDVGPYRTTNRDRPMQATSAPPGARQTWELYRVREESRDLALRSPIWGGYVRFVRIQALGYRLARISFDQLDDADKQRLAEVLKWLRKEWRAFQMIRGLGGTGLTVHELAGSVLHHKEVDGDCFLTWRMVQGKRVYDLHPGDALSETDYGVSDAGNRSRQLGVEVDDYGRPIAYYFGQGGRIPKLHWGYPYTSSLFSQKRVPANSVVHIRERSGEVTAVRGWPRCTNVVEDIARLDEWYSALVRSATLRASIGLALERPEWIGDPAALSGGGQAPGQVAQQQIDPTEQTTYENEPRRRYQQFQEESGSVVELDPGFKPHQITTGTPTGQEAEAIAMLERRVCTALRVSPATLLGDYGGLNFSAGQLAHVQERQSIDDLQGALKSQFYRPVFGDFLIARWLRMMGEFDALRPDDLRLLRYPTFHLRKYQVVDKQRLIAPLLKAWEKGAMTLEQLQDEMGWDEGELEDFVEQWKKERKLLGLPESPSQKNEKTPPANEDA